MKEATRHLVVTAFTVVLSAASLPAATIYTAALSGVNEVPPVATPGAGSATLTLNGNALNVAITFSGLTTPDVASHIHCCAVLGITAPIALGFSTFPTGITAGSFNSSYDLLSAAVYTPAFLTLYGTAAGAEAALINGLNTGLAYVNIHTSANPGGEVRGQVSVVTPEPGAFTLLGIGAAGLLAAWRRKVLR